MSQVILVAFEVYADSRENAHDLLTHELQRIPLGGGPFDADQVIDSWWVAEDDRRDGSDNDSAVFVPFGEQARGVACLTAWSVHTAQEG